MEPLRHLFMKHLHYINKRQVKNLNSVISEDGGRTKASTFQENSALTFHDISLSLFKPPRNVNLSVFTASGTLYLDLSNTSFSVSFPSHILPYK